MNEEIRKVWHNDYKMVNESIWNTSLVLNDGTLIVDFDPIAAYDQMTDKLDTSKMVIEDLGWIQNHIEKLIRMRSEIQREAVVQYLADTSDKEVLAEMVIEKMGEKEYNEMVEAMMDARKED